MELFKQVCSLELARRLKELGVKQESLFWWQVCADGTTELQYQKTTTNYGIPVQEYYSAFTVTELGALLPVVVHRYTPIGKEHHSDIRYWKNGYKWCIRIGEFDDEEMPCLDFSGDSEADARAHCLIYLVKNKLV